MSSQSNVSDSQETPSSWSAFRDEREDDDVVEQMHEAAEQMGEGMPVGLGGEFEYRGGERRTTQTDQGVEETAEGEETVSGEIAEGSAESDAAGVGCVILRAPTREEKPSTPPLGWVTLCADMLKQGVRLPLSPFIQRWMSQLGVAPHQMNPNVYMTMVSVQALWRRVHNAEPTMNQVLHCFLLKRSPHQVGFCYLQSAVGKIIESNPSSQKTWKPHWFYASGAWERLCRTLVLGLVVWPTLDRADLSAAEEEQVNQVLTLPSTERVASKLLASAGQVPAVSRSPARGSSKRRAEESLPRETGKRRAEEETRRDPGKRPMGAASLDAPRRASVDPVCGPLEPWANGEAALGAYHTAVKRILKVDVVEGLFTEEMG
ncbi:unnamed protein product [Prunus brigantina]